MAKVFIDVTAHRPTRGGGADYATRWYSLGSAEPAGRRPLPISAVHAVSPMTLDNLLTAIVTHCAPNDDIIVVGHGREGGLSMRVLPGSETRTRVEVAGSLGRTQAMSDPDLGTIPAISDREAAATCQITESQVQALRQKLAQVRAKGLNHVAFRACRLGAWPDVLAQYKPFFGCREVSAPSLRDTYGQLDPAIVRDLSAWCSTWGRSHRANFHSYIYSAHQVAIATSGGQSDEHSYQNAVAALTEQGLTGWQSQYLRASPGRVPFPYHAQWRTTPSPTEPSMVFVGDPEYVRNIVVR